MVTSVTPSFQPPRLLLFEHLHQAVQEREEAGLHVRRTSPRSLCPLHCVSYWPPDPPGMKSQPGIPTSAPSCLPRAALNYQGLDWGPRMAGGTWALSSCPSCQTHPEDCGADLSVHCQSRLRSCISML